MKKILAIMLAVMLTLSMSVVAFAADEITDQAGSVDGDVKINVSATNEEGKEIENAEDVDPEDAIYALDIDLDDYTFTYNLGTYNTDTHTYSSGTAWNGYQKDSFDVINHSNTAVGITAQFSNSSNTITDNGVTSTISNGVFDLASAVNSGSNPPEKTVEVSVDGTPTNVKNWTIETITLTIEGKTLA